MRSSGGSTLNLLDKFYQDPQKYAYTFQNYVFMSRVMQVRNLFGTEHRQQVWARWSVRHHGHQPKPSLVVCTVC